ncbi:hypothetical protein [Paraliobacillus sp. X-1268]|uniref:hypothetical protein n=1 Tax=Paraliobacillus sp. X-1268 TaxID=2213193 RepID=UPI0013006056|nr:hypothetical protein [Paraliobacillus sp. X-1268]
MIWFKQGNPIHLDSYRKYAHGRKVVIRSYGFIITPASAGFSFSAVPAVDFGIQKNAQV